MRFKADWFDWLRFVYIRQVATLSPITDVYNISSSLELQSERMLSFFLSVTHTLVQFVEAALHFVHLSTVILVFYRISTAMLTLVRLSVCPSQAGMHWTVM